MPMLIRVKCPRCGNFTNPVDVSFITNHSIIKCTNSACLKEFSSVGLEAMLVRNPLENGQIVDKPGTLKGAEILSKARKFVDEANPDWSESELFKQCWNHLLDLRHPAIPKKEAEYYTYIALAEKESLRCPDHEFDFSLSTSKAICISTNVEKLPPLHVFDVPKREIYKIIIPLSNVLERAQIINSKGTGLVILEDN